MAKGKKEKNSKYANKLKRRKRLSGSRGYETLNGGRLIKLPLPFPILNGLKEVVS